MTDSFYNFDTIIIGGGHAGTEAALAAARAGARTLLLSHNIETVGAMSCNPAIGGIGKGHLVREIDALGGVMAHAADAAGIQWRRLNASKGPAVRATRCQADRALYRAFIRRTVEQQPGLNVFQVAVDDLIIESNGQRDVVRGVITQTGLRFYAPTVVLTVGTFLAGKVHIGPTRGWATPRQRRWPHDCASAPLAWTGSRPALRRASTDARWITRECRSSPVMSHARCFHF